MKNLKIILSSIAVVIAGGLLLAGCSGNISLLAIVLGYGLATGAVYTLSGCGDQGPEIITNPAPEDMDEDGFYEWEDCDDTDAQVNPGAMEICDDGKDNDCDNATDMDDTECEDMVTNPAPENNDDDGFDDENDCRDDDADISLDAEEICDDGIDNDCDDLIDEADDDCPEIVVNPAPEDGDDDGFFEWEDCRDDDADINPDAEEVCDDGIDNDCDDLIDEADEECAEIIVNPGPEDADNDGFFAWEDCRDDDENINPGADENCFDGIDNDCDNAIDDADDECADIVTNPMPEDF